MKENSDYTIPFTVNPNNTYIEKIEYYSNDSNVAYISDNKIISNNVGEAIITMVINNNVSRNIIVKVSKNAPSNRFVEDVVSVTFDNKAITMEKGTAKELKYQINPSNGYVDTIDWESSNNEVITVKDGLINAIKEGEAIVTVRVNNTIESRINIKVKDPIITPTPTENETIVIEKKPKESIEIGEYTDIIAHVKPTTSSKAIKFMSSRPNVATVDQNGIIKGISPGTTTITLFIGNSNAKFYTIKVTSTASNVKYTWGYESSKAKTPVYANKGFFQNLASKGRGTFNGDVYYISSSLGQFSYNLNTSVLTVNGGKSIKVRIFYPESTDLSLANTLVYLGGDGEKDFGGYFSTIASNPSIMRSSGILILVAQGNGVSFDADSAICATKFVQVITNQKSGVKNSILGFSTGGKYVLEASHRFNYYKTVIFSSWSADPASTVNVKNKEVLYFIPYGDSLYRLAKDTLVELRNYGYKYVTLVTNSSELLGMFNGSGFRLINPGSGMISGHVSSNVASSGIVAYVND